MPIVLILVGFALLGAVLRGQEERLFEVLKDDFTGQNNFVAWLMALIILGVIGASWEAARPVTEGFIVLVIVALLVSQQGFWEQLKRQVLQ